MNKNHTHQEKGCKRSGTLKRPNQLNAVCLLCAVAFPLPPRNIKASLINYLKIALQKRHKRGDARRKLALRLPDRKNIPIWCLPVG